MHSDHDRSFCSRCSSDQVLVQYSLLFEHAFPMEVAAFPLQNKDIKEESKESKEDLKRDLIT